MHLMPAREARSYLWTEKIFSTFTPSATFLYRTMLSPFPGLLFLLNHPSRAGFLSAGLGIVFPIDHVNDGWIFKSTLMPDADNAVIVPANAHTKLSVKNVLVAQFISADADEITA